MTKFPDFTRAGLEITAVQCKPCWTTLKAVKVILHMYFVNSFVELTFCHFCALMSIIIWLVSAREVERTLLMISQQGSNSDFMLSGNNPFLVGQRWPRSMTFIVNYMASLGHNELTHWGRDEMNNISQTTFSNVFSSMKMCEFRWKFHWSLFPRVQLTIFQHWFR